MMFNYIRHFKYFQNFSMDGKEDILNYTSYQNGEIIIIESFQNIQRKNGYIER